jgi:glycine rich protein
MSLAMDRQALRRPRAAITLAALAVGLGSSGAFAQPASASTQTFGFTGLEQPYMVPAGVHSVHVIAVGAMGGSGSDSGENIGGSPGFGARVEADLPVTAGQILFIEVGGTGADGGGIVGGGAGGFNGGGSSNNGEFHEPGGGGGGATDIRTCSMLAAGCALAPDTLSSRLLVAGGGGGGGSDGQGVLSSGGEGGDAGKNGQTGQAMNCSTGSTPGGGGGAGTESAGGAGGMAGILGGALGNPGTLGQGGGAGTSSTNSQPGGGGGGGFFGGGAGGGGNGCAAGGGGGGSNFAAPSASGVSSAIDATVPAQVVITSVDRDFSFGRLKRNKRTGTAQLIVDTPSPGMLTLTGKGLVKQTVSVGGRVKLSVRTRGKRNRLLRRAGTVKVSANVTYTPNGAAAISKVRNIRLVKRRR